MAFDMTDYVDVKHRLQLALLQHPTLNIVEEAPELITITDLSGASKVFIQCAVTVFRTPDDINPCRAYCWEVFPGRTPFTKDSEQPNGATSALGRALGYMGFGIGGSIASANEIRTAQGNSQPVTDEPRPTGSRTTTTNQGETIRGMATQGQIALITNMAKERRVAPPENMETMTYNAASETISHLKTVPKVKDE